MEKTENKLVPFPQANDFDKIFLLIEIDDEENLKDNVFLTNYLGITSRQVNYYLSACEFLDIVEKRKFTDFGLSLRSMGLDHKIATISSKIVSKPVFGEVFFLYYFYSEKMSIDEIAELITFRYGNSLDKIAPRRASTVNNWIKWINKNKTELTSKTID
jgi:hypothetical protein